MTIAELIEKLRQYPQDYKVTCIDSRFGIMDVKVVREADLEENKDKVVLDYYDG